MGGVAGSDPFYEYQPDLVIVAVNKTDVLDVKVRGGMERFLPNGKVRFNPVPKVEPYFKRSYLLRFILLKVLRYDWLYHSPSKQREENESALDLIVDALLSMDELGIDNDDFKIVVLFHPIRYEVEYDDYVFNWNKVIDSLEFESISTIDLKPFFVDRVADVHDYFWPSDHHHNAAGYALFAEGVEEGLLELGVLDELFEKDSILADTSAVLN